LPFSFKGGEHALAVFTIQPQTLASSKMAFVVLGYDAYDTTQSTTVNHANQITLGDLAQSVCIDPEDPPQYEYWDSHYQAYIQFDLTGVTGNVVSAVLSLYPIGNADTPMSVGVKAVTSAWSKTTITGATIPTNEATEYGYGLVPNLGAWKDFDVTQIVGRMVAGTLVNNGFVIGTHAVSGTSSTVSTRNADEFPNTTIYQCPKLVITTGITTPTISNANIISASNISLAFVTIPPRLTFPVMAISSSSIITVGFVGSVTPLVFSATIQSASQVALLLIAVPILTFIASLASQFSVQLSIRIVVAGYFILKGHVAIGGVAVINANVRVLSDDGSKVFSSTTDVSGNYEVAVNTAGIYHMLCYKKDTDGSVYSSVSQPYINVVAV